MTYVNFPELLDSDNGLCVPASGSGAPPVADRVPSFAWLKQVWGTVRPEDPPLLKEWPLVPLEDGRLISCQLSAASLTFSPDIETECAANQTNRPNDAETDAKESVCPYEAAELRPVLTALNCPVVHRCAFVLSLFGIFH